MSVHFNPTIRFGNSAPTSKLATELRAAVQSAGITEADGGEALDRFMMTGSPDVDPKELDSGAFGSGSFRFNSVGGQVERLLGKDSHFTAAGAVYRAEQVLGRRPETVQEVIEGLKQAAQ